MSDRAAAEAEAEVAAEGPRFSVLVGAVVGFLGRALLSAAAVFLLAVRTGGWLLPVAVGVGLAYALALLVWAGLWRRPLAVAAVVGASLAGLLCGYVLGLVLLWTAVPATRPNLAPA